MGRPQELKKIFDGMKGRQLNKLMTACFVIPSWHSIVGENIALHCKPVSFENGNLQIECDSSTWCSQISDYRSLILERISDIVGHGIVTKLNPVVARRPMEKISKTNVVSEKEIQQISPKKFAWAETVAESVPKDIRESFLGAMLAMMSNGKKRSTQ
ncbi:MAG: DUF721 domain-containing protein [Caldisericia bacterium]|nr:DUF721 domain-containing protein [Caldisericia bacterium]